MTARKPKRKPMEAWALLNAGTDGVEYSLGIYETKEDAESSDANDYGPGGIRRVVHLVEADPRAKLKADVVKAARAYFRPHDAECDHDPALERLRVAVEQLEGRKS